jgi:hypothetical protein
MCRSQLFLLDLSQLFLVAVSKIQHLSPIDLGPLVFLQRPELIQMLAKQVLFLSSLLPLIQAQETVLGVYIVRNVQPPSRNQI